ncbi:MAG: DUF6134 family protein [Rhodopila sp.]
MITRRAVLAGTAALPFRQAHAALPIPPGDRLAFHIIRKGSTIGEHVITFERARDALTVSVTADIVVGLGPIAFFRYKHRATVQWDDVQVVSINAETNDDGTPRHMTARRDESGLVVEGSRAPRYTAPPRSLPGTHWNRAMLDAPFINIEDGRLMSPKVTLVGMETVEVTGGSVEAQHYTMRGDADLDTFYDLTPAWVGLRFTSKDGSEIRYLRL